MTMDENRIRQQKNQLMWRCRQGSRELELVLFGFLEHGYPSMTHEEQHEFQRLLEFSNSQLSDWLIYGAKTYDDAFSPLIERIKDCHLIEHK